MVDVRPDPKPLSEGGIGRKKPARGKRTRGRKMATPREWTALRKEKLGPCRVCTFWVEWGVNPLPRDLAGRIQLHHLIPRARGGHDDADNLVPLCQSHHELVTAGAPMQLSALARSLTDAEYAYVVDKLGEGALERLFGVGA